MRRILRLVFSPEIICKIKINKRYWGQNGCILAKFFSFFLRFVLVNKNAQKKLIKHTVILTEQAWSIKNVLYDQKLTFLRNQGRISQAHLACSGSQSEHRIRFFSPARGFSHIKNSSFSRQKKHKTTTTCRSNHHLLYVVVESLEYKRPNETTGWQCYWDLGTRSVGTLSVLAAKSTYNTLLTMRYG